MIPWLAVIVVLALWGLWRLAGRNNDTW